MQVDVGESRYGEDGVAQLLLRLTAPSSLDGRPFGKMTTPAEAVPPADSQGSSWSYHSGPAQAGRQLVTSWPHHIKPW